MKTCAFYTLGCKVNQYETQGIRESFIRAGYKERDFEDSCDVYVINTCTVTAKTDRESRRLIREAHRSNPLATVIVTGCYVERDGDKVNGVPGGHIIVRNKDKDKIVNIAASKETAACSGAAAGDRSYAEFSISGFKDRTKAFLKVQDGCDNFCSYCKVPLVRGRARSRSMEASLEEAERLVAAGFKEIVLTGICLGAWGQDLSSKAPLDALLEELVRLKGDFRIRLSSIEPKYVDTRLISTIKSSPRFCRHLHMPFQSGDDSILKAMNRPYTAEAYLDTVDMVRQSIPEASITTDIMTGFPGETEDNFRNTCRFIEKVRPSRIHIFSYSKREGTPAASFSFHVPGNVVTSRLARLKDLASRASYDYRKNFLRKKTDVLVETDRDGGTGLLIGYDDKYIRILLEGKDEHKSRIVPVTVQKVDIGGTFGAVV